MKKLLLSVLFLSLVLGAKAAPPSAQSVDHLLEVMQAKKMVDGMVGQVSRMMDSMVKRMAATQQLSPEDAVAMKKEDSKVMADMFQALSWERLKSIYVKAYSETFTQEEVDGMIGFYGTPTGQAVISKMPQVMQRTMAIMQPQVMQLATKARTDLQEFAAQLQASHAGKQEAASSPSMPPSAQ